MTQVTVTGKPRVPLIMKIRQTVDLFAGAVLYYLAADVLWYSLHNEHLHEAVGEHLHTCRIRALTLREINQTRAMIRDLPET